MTLQKGTEFVLALCGVVISRTTTAAISRNVEMSDRRVKYLRLVLRAASSSSCIVLELHRPRECRSAGSQVCPTVYDEVSITPTSWLQNSQTYQKRKMTAARKPSHTLHPTPVRSAIRSIRFIVPFNLVEVESKVSFIEAARLEESLISSPMARVSWTTGKVSVASFNLGHDRTYIF
jgi:hypothetical protein